MSKNFPATESILQVPRRAILYVAIGGFTSSALILLTGPHAHATSQATGIVVRPDKENIYFPMPDGAVLEAARTLGGTFVVVGDTVSRGSTLTVSWDNRIYEAGPVSLLQGGTRVECQGQPVVDVGGGQMRQILDIQEALRPGVEYDLRIGNGRTHQFPQDIISEPLKTEITLQIQGGSSTYGAVSVPQASLEGAVWGGIVGSSWAPVVWGNGYHSWRPDYVTVRSVGPDAIPSGTRVQVQLDQRLFTGITIRSQSDTTVQSLGYASGSQVGASWTLAAALAAGERLTLRVEAPFTLRGSPLLSIEPPTVAMHASKASIGQRFTGQESLTRIDSAATETTKEMFPLELFPVD